MLLVIDVGNTRTKWAQANENASLQDVQVCLNADVGTSQQLMHAVQSADKVVIANVAGDAILQQITRFLPAHTSLHEVKAQTNACGVANRYQPTLSLGADRWAAVVAAWHMHKQPAIVVNAGTAVTIDALARDAGTKGGVFIGGCIVPGLRLMQEALALNTAKLGASTGVAERHVFPTNTRDAIHMGCMNAIEGAVNIMLQQLEKHSAYLPKLIISGGDAEKIAEALKPHLKRVMIVENLVLQGLVLLELDSLEKEQV